MSSPLDLKQLKKLVLACRKAGIKQFKCADYEFTLTDLEPSTIRKSQIVQKKSNTLMDQALSQEDDFDTDSLTEDQLLMWSVSELPPEETKSE